MFSCGKFTDEAFKHPSSEIQNWSLIDRVESISSTVSGSCIFLIFFFAVTWVSGPLGPESRPL